MLRFLFCLGLKCVVQAIDEHEVLEHAAKNTSESDSSILDGCCHAKMQVSLHLDVLVTVFICSRVVRSISSCLGFSLRPFWTQTSWTFIASLLAVRYLAQPLGFVLYVAVPLWEPGFLDFHRVLLGNQVSCTTFGVSCFMSPCPFWASGFLDFHRVLVGSQVSWATFGVLCFMSPCPFWAVGVWNCHRGSGRTTTPSEWTWITSKAL